MSRLTSRSHHAITTGKALPVKPVERRLLTPLLTLAAVLALALPAAAQAGACPNEALRVGPSANLPDCRAYELVTPADKGRTQDITFDQGNEEAVPSADGESIALETLVQLEPNPRTPASIIGARAVFVRTATGWEMKSAVPPGGAADRLEIDLLSPDLSHLALDSYTALNLVEISPDNTFEVGPVGGPYEVVANVPREYDTNFAGANAGTADVPNFRDILLSSFDHALATSAVERTVAEETEPNARDLYEWSDGRLQLVNVTSSGQLLSKCGAILGSEGAANGASTTNAVSNDGSKIFFISFMRNGAGCEENEAPATLYMRVEGNETVELSPLAHVPAAERHPVTFNGATADGSDVYFSTETPLLAGEQQGEDRLFRYNTVSRTLRFVAGGLQAGIASIGITKAVVVAEEGSAVYYETSLSEQGYNDELYRYEPSSERSTLIARFDPDTREDTRSYATPNSQFLLFAARSVAGEPRGQEHEELYRYDNADKSVICVTCGQGVAPAQGETIFLSQTGANLATQDEQPEVTQITADGQRVFFQTTARLVPQDRNSTSDQPETGELAPQGLDVYEWEADGVEEEPGVSCRVSVGCTHMLSSGEETGPSVFLGTSADGSNVFLATAARLAPQDIDEYGDIYDARVDGGFPAAPPVPECTSCQGVGSPPPLFGTSASEAFVGAGNPVTLAATPAAAKPQSQPAKPKAKKRRRKRSRGKRSRRASKAGARGARDVARVRGTGA